MAPSQTDSTPSTAPTKTTTVTKTYIPDATSTAVKSKFATLPVYPLDEPFALNAEFTNDSHPNKVNLGIGVYRAEDGKPWPLPVVRRVEEQLLHENNPARHDYLPIQGDMEFLAFARDLVFGFDYSEDKNKGKADGVEQQPERSLHQLHQELKKQQQKDRIASIQTVSGTGANRVGADFLTHSLKPETVWIPKPTWSNHHAIWACAGANRQTYPYFDNEGKCFDYEATARTLNAHAKPGDVIILHACAHNPTGADPSKEQWSKLADLCHEKRLFPFFDFAYQGFASGSVKDDAWAIRHFFNYNTSSPLDFAVAQSFSKNFGLYGQRTGALHVVVSRGNNMDNLTATRDTSDAVLSNLCHLVRGEYSMPPRAGSDIVKTVLSSAELRARWHDDLQVMSGRIKKMRRLLFDELERLGTPGKWDHILHQIGMFSYTGLSESQVLAIRARHHVYMLVSGRVSMSGLNERNARHVAEAIDDVVRNVA